VLLPRLPAGGSADHAAGPGEARQAGEEGGHSGATPGPVCYLHIGLHKTASSSMQQMILRNVERLAAAGIYVPEASTARYSKIHHELAAELNSRSGRPTTNWFEHLRDELGAQNLPPRILLSSEDFSRKLQREPVRRALGSFFDELGYRLRVIVYLRPQDRSMNSTYAQHVKGFLFDFDFDEYRERVFRQNPVWFDYHRLLTPLLDDPGFDCDVRPFNRATLQRGVEEDLLSAIGVPLDEATGFRKVPPANRTPGPKTIAACLEIARRIRAGGWEPARVRRKRVSRRLQQTAVALGWEETQFSGLTPQTAGEIRERYAEGNDLLSTRVWGRPWAEVFAAEIAQPVLLNRFDSAAADPKEREEFERAVEDLWETAKAEMAEKQV
jgi:hypothetical protein